MPAVTASASSSLRASASSVRSDIDVSFESTNASRSSNSSRICDSSFSPSSCAASSVPSSPSVSCPAWKLLSDAAARSASPSRTVKGAASSPVCLSPAGAASSKNSDHGSSASSAKTSGTSSAIVSPALFSPSFTPERRAAFSTEYPTSAVWFKGLSDSASSAKGSVASTIAAFDFFPSLSAAKISAPSDCLSLFSAFSDASIGEHGSFSCPFSSETAVPSAPTKTGPSARCSASLPSEEASKNSRGSSQGRDSSSLAPFSCTTPTRVSLSLFKASVSSSRISLESFETGKALSCPFPKSSLSSRIASTFSDVSAKSSSCFISAGEASS